MLMQRCPEAEVTGIDIDEAAVEQAKENGVRAFCSSLQEWQPETADGYDLIVSNPPYFQNSLKNPDAGRMTARHTDTLSYAELIHHSARLLRENGQLALILPAEAETEVRGLAAAEQLSPVRATRVFSKEGKPAIRTLMAFEKFKIQNSYPKRGTIISKFKILEDSLVLEDEKGGRSASYSELTKDFYL
jgi:tRNA1Val (adenine37-N6)-methyltransferase